MFKIMRDKDDDGSTPLLLAVGSGRSEIVKMLLERKDNVNTRNKMLVHPVHSAARTGDLEILKILVKVGHSPFLDFSFSYNLIFL